ncbi:hypothetical protein F441_12083 [Phytophthora nicotianae CJ01A1]|uniref:Uncharacterized protein n=1 Tax=Phytophthora nicotianae CJ01A1 TaxID=1317063 RepID=W2WQX6_PHYNI|nr:hypothetical protein F441_12083 [Phytophthora nicotianae CJ01A1]
MEPRQTKNPATKHAKRRPPVNHKDLENTNTGRVTTNCIEEPAEHANKDTPHKTQNKSPKKEGVIINDLISKGKTNSGTS